MKFLLLVVFLAAGALALTMVTTGQASKGDIFGTDHDTGTAGSPTCAQCHIPHRAAGSYLWAMVPDPGYSGDSDILPLCFSCHDNAIAPSGGYIPDAPHNHPQGVVTYDPDHVPDSGDEYPITEHARYQTSCKKCMEPDCVKCHDAHSSAWLFLDQNRFTPTDYDKDGDNEDLLNASVCAWCHSGSSHGVESYAGATRLPHTTHPEMISHAEGANNASLPAGANRDWSGDAGDLIGTRLWSDDTIYANQPAADDSGHYTVASGPGDVRCMSCHTTHGAEDEHMTTMATSTGTDSHSPICENCHQ